MAEVKYRKTQGELSAEQSDLLQSIKTHAHEEAYGVPLPEAPTPEPVDPAAEGDPDGIPVGFPTDPGHIFTTTTQFVEWRDQIKPAQDAARAEANRRRAAEQATQERRRRLRVERLRETEAKAQARVAEVKERVSVGIDTLTKSVKDVYKARDAAAFAASEGTRLTSKVNDLYDAFATAYEAAEAVERAHVAVGVAEAELKLATYRRKNPDAGDNDFAAMRLQSAAVFGRSGTYLPQTAGELLVRAGLPGQLRCSVADLAGHEVADALPRLHKWLRT
jgi:hypothetical protein